MNPVEEQDVCDAHHRCRLERVLKAQAFRPSDLAPMQSFDEKVKVKVSFTSPVLSPDTSTP